jgi:hypothetical protein
MMKLLFEKKIKLPTALGSNPWSLLVCMKLDDKTKEKLVNHEVKNFDKTIEVNNRVKR